MKVSFLVILMCVVSASIQWKSFDEGIHEVESQKKPGIVLIHHSTCPACIKLNKIIQNSSRIEELSKQYVMMSCKNGKEPNDIDYKGDGAYVPRLFFVSQNGRILTQVKASEGSSRYKYYYYNERQLIHNMERVLHLSHKNQLL